MLCSTLSVPKMNSVYICECASMQRSVHNCVDTHMRESSHGFGKHVRISIVCGTAIFLSRAMLCLYVYSQNMHKTTLIYLLPQVKEASSSSGMQKLSAKFKASHLEYNKKAAKLIDVIRIQQDWVSARYCIAFSKQ
jgi:hypothetical protein